MLQFVHGIVAPLADVPVAELALQIYLQAAYSASEVARLEMIAYEFLEQVCILAMLPCFASILSLNKEEAPWLAQAAAG